MFSKSELTYSLSQDEEKIFINSTILRKDGISKNGFYELS